MNSTRPQVAETERRLGRFESHLVDIEWVATRLGVTVRGVAAWRMDAYVSEAAVERNE